MSHVETGGAAVQAEPATGSGGLSARTVILALATGGFAIGTTEFAAMTLVPYFAGDLGVTEARAADAVSAYALGVVIGAPVLAVLGASLSKRMLLVWLMVAFTVFNIASAFAPTFGTLLLFRFLSGLPHGAYFGVAALVAISVVGPGKRATAVSRVMLGLPISTIVGVPLANVLAQGLTWRWGFAIVGVLSLITVVSIFFFAPRDKADPAANPMRELSALKNRRVILTLVTGAVGFGGFFAVYTYVTSTLSSTMQVDAAVVPWVLMIAGVGMTFFTMLFGYMADKNLKGTGYFALIAGIIVLLLYPVSVGSLWTYVPIVFCVPILGGLSTVLQTRLMDVAGDAQQLAAASNHAAFNIANAIGPFLAARAIAAGYDFPVSGYVGAGLAVAGLALYAFMMWDDRKYPS